RRLDRPRGAVADTAFRAGVVEHTVATSWNSSLTSTPHPTWLRLMERCPGLGHARIAEAGPLELKSRCSSTSLRLLPRVVVRADVGESPWTDGADLYNRHFIDEDVVCRAWRKGVETARGETLRLARIGVLSPSHAEGSGDHR